MRGLIALVAGTLVVAACGSGAEPGAEAVTDTPDTQAQRALIDRSLHCMNGYDRLGKFYLTVSEVEDDAAEAAKMREQAASYLDVINAYQDYARNRAAEIGLPDEEYQAAEAAAKAWYDERYEAQEFEEFLGTVDAEVKDCETALDAGTFG